MTNAKLKYRVTSVANDEFEVDATVGEQTVRAKVPGLVVEMSSEDGSMGHTYRIGTDVAAAEEFFRDALENDAVVVLTFTKEA